MKETWKLISGYEGLYEVSDLGRIKSLKFGKEKILKPWNDGFGYLQVSLCKDGKVKHPHIHRLVAQAFIPNPLNLPQVNHKDEVKTNNIASNLEWMTNKDNVNYGTRNKRVAEALSQKVQMFEKQGNLLASFPSIVEASRVTGVNHGHIWSCCNGERQSGGGFGWRYQVL